MLEPQLQPQLLETPSKGLRYEYRLIRAFTVDACVPLHLHAIVWQLLDVGQIQDQPYPRTRRDRSGEAHLVEPVIDADATGRHVQRGGSQLCHQGERQITMSDGGLVGRFVSCALDIHMDPLMVATDIGKFIYHFLRHFDPVAGWQVLAYEIL